MDAPTAAELQHDNPRRDRDAQGFMVEALEDCVERVMDGKAAQKGSYWSVGLYRFLDDEISLNEQAEWLVQLLTTREPKETVCRIKADVEARLRQYLEGSDIVAARAEEMAEDWRQDHDDYS